MNPVEAARERPILAGGLVLLFVAGAGVLDWLAEPSPGWQREFRTATGQRREVQLADGSTAHLDAGTRIRCRFEDGQRRIRLLRGRAVFRVRSGKPRPFVVSTPTGHSIRVTGTVFSVHTVAPLSGASQRHRRTRVAVQEGSVRLLSSAINQTNRGAVLLKHGQQAVWAVDQPEPNVRPFSHEHFAAWREGRLRYRGASLAAVVDDLRRYGATAIELTDPKLADLKLTGTFQTQDFSAIFQAIELTLPVRVRRPAQGRLRIEPAPEGATRSSR